MRPSLRRPCPSPTGGFTFMEVLVVMALMAVLMGLGVGYLRGIGRGTRSSQARAILRETAYACKQSSNGGTRAIFDLREKDETLWVGAAIASPVLTHNFESLDFVSRDYPLRIEGGVEAVSDGYVGRAGRFKRGSSILFDPQSAFAMTEGLEVSVWLRPELGPTTMTIVKGEGAYEVQLVQDPGGRGYDVRMRVMLQDVTDGGGRSAGVMEEFKTKGGAVRTDGSWTHLRVGYDGESASVRIDGLEVLRPGRRRSGSSIDEDEAGGRAARRKQIVVPAGGAVALSLGDGATSYVGLMDSFVLGGVFRSTETDREVFGLKLIRKPLPVRVVYQNGRLDPDEHSADVVLYFQDLQNPEGPLIELRLGRYGTIEERFVTAGSSP